MKSKTAKIWAVILSMIILLLSTCSAWINVPIFDYINYIFDSDIQSMFTLTELEEISTYISEYDTYGEFSGYTNAISKALFLIPLYHIILIILLLAKSSWAREIGRSAAWFALIFSIVFIFGVNYLNDEIFTALFYEYADSGTLIEATPIPYIYGIVSLIQYFVFIKKVEPKKESETAKPVTA